MTNTSIENTLEIDLPRFLNKPLEVAEREISEKLQSTGRPVNIVIPSHDKRVKWQMYKDLMSFLISLTSKKVKMMSDQETYELCRSYTGGYLSGDARNGYFLNM